MILKENKSGKGRGSNMNRIKKLRLEESLSQKELADAIGVERTVITKFESGARGVNMNAARKLSDYFGCSIEYLLGQPEVGLDDESVIQAYHVLSEPDKEVVDLILSRYLRY